MNVKTFAFSASSAVKCDPNNDNKESLTPKMTMLKEIGRHFDIGASGVSQTSRRIAMKISQDNKLREKIKKIENKLKLSRMKT